jgi:hypothetical protein
MLDSIDVACGSIIGRDHVTTGKILVGKSNQDAVCYNALEDIFVGVCCDGCGGSGFSEFGSRFGCNVIVNSVLHNLWTHRMIHGYDRLLRKVKQDVVSSIHSVARQFGGNYTDVIVQHFLFTIVGVMITRKEAVVFNFGDGVFAYKYNSLDPAVFHDLGPFPNNEPPYIAYNLVESSNTDTSWLDFKVAAKFPVHEMPNIMIGTDGVGDLARASEKCLPGRTEQVGGISQFWESKYFDNPEAIRQRLRLCNAEITKLDRENVRIVKHSGLLPDDTTLLVVKRKNA